MKHLRKIFIILLLTVLPLNAFADAVELTVSETVEKTLSNSTEAVKAGNTLEKTLNSLKSSSYIPSLSLGANVVQNLDYLHLSATKAPSVTFSGGISWSFKTSSVFEDTTKNLSIEIANLTYQSSLYNIRSDAESAYWNLVLLEQKVENAERNYNNAQDSLKSTQELFEASMATLLNVKQAELSVSEARISYDNAVKNYEDARKDLLADMGMEDCQVVLTSGFDADAIDVSKLESVADEFLRTSTSWKLAELTLESTQTSLESSNLESFLPSIGLSVNANASRDVVNKMTNVGTTATFNVSVPLDSYIPGTKSNASVKNNRIEKENARLTYESTIDSLSERVETINESIKNLVELRTSLKAYSNLAEESYKTVSKAYSEGYCSLSELNNAQNTWKSASSSLLDNSISIINNLCSLSSLIDLDFEQLTEKIK